MQIIAHIERTKKTTKVKLPAKATVKHLLEKLAVNPVTVLVTRDSKVLIETQELKDKDTVKILSVVSGG